MADTSHSTPPARLTWRAALDVVATLAIIAAAATLIWRVGFVGPATGAAPARPEIPVPTEPLSLDGAPTLGSHTADVVVIEFSDFECPYCSRFAEQTMPALKTQYIDSGRVQLAFRHLPLANHARARPAAASAVCAARQGRFWPMHDTLFASRQRLADDDLRTHASASGLDLGPFEACLAGDAPLDVERDLEAARALQITGTPTFLIGRRTTGGQVQVTEIIRGAVPLAEFARVLDGLLAP